MPGRRLAPGAPNEPARGPAARGRAVRGKSREAARAMPRPYEELGALVIRTRVGSGLTQEELAGLMATSASAISRLERGKHRPSLETLERIGKALRMTLIVGFEDEAGERHLVRV